MDKLEFFIEYRGKFFIEYKGKQEYFTIAFLYVEERTICTIEFAKSRLNGHQGRPYIGLARKHPKDIEDSYAGMRAAAKYACQNIKGKGNGMSELGKLVYQGVRLILRLAQEQECSLSEFIKVVDDKESK